MTPNRIFGNVDMDQVSKHLSNLYAATEIQHSSYEKSSREHSQWYVMIMTGLMVLG